MAFQLYVQPRSDYIADAIASAGESIGQGFRDIRERKEQRKQEAGMIEGFKKLVSSDPELGKSLGINSDEDWDNFSANQVRGMYDGIKLRATAGQQKLQEMQMTDFERRHQAMNAEDAARSAETGFLREAGMFQRQPDAPFSPETQQRYSAFLENPDAAFAADYATQTGYAPGQQFMERYGPMAQEQPWMPSIADASAFGGRQGDQVFMQSPTSAQLIRQQDENGRKLPPEEVLAGAIRNARETGDEEMAGMLQSAWDKKMTGAQLSPMEMFFLQRLDPELAKTYSGYTKPGAQPGAQPPPAPKANPMTADEFRGSFR